MLVWHFISKVLFGAANTPTVTHKLPKVFGIEAASIVAFIIVILLWIFLYRTKWGLRLLSVAEHPAAANTLGINVYKVRYLAVIMSGFFSGLGGGTVTLSLLSNFTTTSIAGQVYSISSCYFGKWTPHGAYGAALIFRLAQAISVYLGGSTFIPSEFIAMIPFVMTLVILVFVGKSETSQKADGTIYKGVR